MSFAEPDPAQVSKDDNRLGYEGGRSERKRQGRYYTDSSLAKPLVAQTLAPLMSGGPEAILNLRICDPSAGAGAFLLEALLYLEKALHSSMIEQGWLDLKAGPGTRAPDWFGQRLSTSPSQTSCLRRLIMERCLHGVDVDPRAAELARECLSHAIGEDAAQLPAQQIRQGDALLGIQEGELPAALSQGSSFRWHDDFSQVFEKGGFDAILGNPPWDILKPDSREFFSHYEPEYRSYTKREALTCQRRLFAANPDIESTWIAYQERNRALAQMLRGNSSPLQHIGRGDLNSYKLFLELSLLLLRPSGRLGMLVPAGLYSDLGCLPLRRFLLEENRWELLMGFENRSRIFAIDGRFKFAAVVLQQGGRTEQIQTAFMRSDPEHWADSRGMNSLSHELITELSPESLAIPEILTARDRDLLAKINDHAIPFGSTDPDSWQIEYRREFDLTLDARHFKTRDELEALGYRPDEHSRWRDSSGMLAMPLIEGRMVAAFSDHQKGWVSGRGRRAVWRDLGPDECELVPQFLVELAELEQAEIPADEFKIAIMAIGSATNSRSMFAASILGMPCGNSAPTLRGPDSHHLPLLAVLNSFVYDYALRSRLGGNNLNHYILRETPLPRVERMLDMPELPVLVASLCWPLPRFAQCWQNNIASKAKYVHEPRERRRIRARLDALVARAYGLKARDLDWILRDCEHSAERLANREFTRSLDQKGFWRVDRQLPCSERLSQLARHEFAALET